MKSQSIRFKNRKNLTLSGRIDLPEDEKPVAWALFAHCFTCGKNLKSMGHICRALTLRKIAVLRFDFTGIGQSEGDFSTSSLSSNVDDLLCAAQWLETRYEMPEILIGHSFGGAAVLQMAARADGIKAVVTIAAPYDPQHITHLIGPSLNTIDKHGESRVSIAGREFTIGKEFISDLATHQSQERIKNLAAALLVMHSPSDNTVNIENARLIYQAAKHPKSFISLDKTDHLLTNQEDAIYVGNMIADWASRYVDMGTKLPQSNQHVDNHVTVRTDSGGFYTEIQAKGFALTADEPISYGGTERGPTPYDYLMAAIGACTGMTLQMYARKKKWPLTSAVVRLNHSKIHATDCQICETGTGKIDRFERELELHGALTDSQKERLTRIADRCPVHQTMHSEVMIETSLKQPLEKK
ncbi:MAG: alpha/beta fold hydrolase [Desulfuromonadales bacterium]|nr:alpha/beta fold hydrolase [Desulfuromonadales bacterium]MBN2793398.1 alpha/beta fold hydrolase [Desulfuromonadales bacterium]